MQYFLDKLKEFLVFLVFSRLVQGVVGTLKSNQEGHSTWNASSSSVHDSVPHMLWDFTPFRGGENEGEWEEDSSGGWLATVCPPNRGERSTRMLIEQLRECLQYYTIQMTR